LRTYKAGGSVVLFGLRHTGAGAYFSGDIEEARLYDRALSAEEISASYRGGVQNLTPEQLKRAFTVDEIKSLETLRTQRVSLQNELKEAEDIPQCYAANPAQPGNTHLLIRGDVESLGEPVTAGGLSAVKTISCELGTSQSTPEGERRLRLAEWIANPNNPLTARVMVNRIWHYHFGRGIVGTPNDFGFNGDRPTNPKLLDWLASEFMAKGWRLKPLHRLILLSNTYRQSSQPNAKAQAVDADDRWLWRFAPRRLEGEAVRDSMLSVSGKLNPQMGGPSFRPFTVFVNNSAFYTPIDNDTPDFNRRTVYRINVNSAKSALLDSLDCPDPSTKTPRRSVTTTALQALELMNSSFVVRQARCFAERIKKSSGTDTTSAVRLSYKLAFGRGPTFTEQKRAMSLVKNSGLDELCWALINSSEFLYVR
jgi:hypothetical protein